MNTSLFHYELPESLIAQHPAEIRDASRLLVVDRRKQTWHEEVFHQIGAYFTPGDTLVMNNTRVIRARLRAVKSTGGRVEIFLLRKLASGAWQALVRPGSRLPEGMQVALVHGDPPVPFDPAETVTIGPALSNGAREVKFSTPDILALLEEAGEVPLPPYIRRDHPEAKDLTRYQTVYAKVPGAVAAPTAGLHFTEEVLADLAARGIQRTEVTLHVGYGTFKPITVEDLTTHEMDAEEYEMLPETADLLNATRNAQRRVASIGTTSVRVLETCYADGVYTPGNGLTRRFIYPPHPVPAIDALLTNFHLPKSTLLALVCAFGGTELILNAYRYAVEQRFRFYSYGDAMLII